MRQTIHRKDGITYERNIKENNFDCHLNIKYHRIKIDKLKEIAKIKGTDYNKLTREILDNYIDTWEKIPAKYLTKE